MLPACWPSLGQLMGQNWAILSDFDVIMFFRKDRAQREGRRCADLLIKTPPDDVMGVVQTRLRLAVGTPPGPAARAFSACP